MKDNGRPALESTALIHFSVLDADDLNPFFQHPAYTARILNSNEEKNNSLLEILPEPIRAKDQDSLDAPIFYSLSGADAPKFHIDAQTGLVRLIDNVKPGETYLLTIHARQTDRPEREAGVSLKVVAQGPNKNVPKFESRHYSVDVLENVPVGTTVARVSATDLDETSVLKYSFVRKDLAVPFELDGLTGEIIVSRPLDFEQRNGYLLEIKADDGKHVRNLCFYKIFQFW